MKSGRKREVKDSCIIANIFADPTDPLPALLGEVSCTHWHQAWTCDFLWPVNGSDVLLSSRIFNCHPVGPCLSFDRRKSMSWKDLLFQPGSWSKEDMKQPTVCWYITWASKRHCKLLSFFFFFDYSNITQWKLIATDAFKNFVLINWKDSISIDWDEKIRGGADMKGKIGSLVLNMLYLRCLL